MCGIVEEKDKSNKKGRRDKEKVWHEKQLERWEKQQERKKIQRGKETWKATRKQLKNDGEEEEYEKKLQKTAPTNQQ